MEILCRRCTIDDEPVGRDVVGFGYIEGVIAHLMMHHVFQQNVVEYSRKAANYL